MSAYGNITIGSPYNVLDTSYVLDTSTGITYNVGASNTTGVSALGNYTVAGSNGSWNNIYSASPSVSLDRDGIQVTESADIKLGDVSLKDFINKIEQRLALLTPNPKLEKEWDELKELGDRYRELEKHITEKMKTWDILKRED